jgi:hypothetical protein
MNIDRNEAIKRIKTALQKRSGKQWSVTGGRGTAWGWVEIDAPPKRRTWQWVQTDSPEPPCPGAVYRGCNCVTPNHVIQEEILADGEESSYQHVTCFADDPWAREAMEAGRPLKFDWEIERVGEFGHMSPADRVELAKLLGLSRPVHYQGHSIAAGSDYRAEYVARAEGRTPEVIGTPYWD